jgi:hypothetical protein
VETEKESQKDQVDWDVTTIKQEVDVKPSISITMPPYFSYPKIRFTAPNETSSIDQSLGDETGSPNSNVFINSPQSPTPSPSPPLTPGSVASGFGDSDFNDLESYLRSAQQKRKRGRPPKITLGSPTLLPVPYNPSSFQLSPPLPPHSILSLHSSQRPSSPLVPQESESVAPILSPSAHQEPMLSPHSNSSLSPPLAYMSTPHSVSSPQHQDGSPQELSYRPGLRINPKKKIDSDHVNISDVEGEEDERDELMLEDDPMLAWTQHIPRRMRDQPKKRGRGRPPKYKKLKI